MQYDPELDELKEKRRFKLPKLPTTFEGRILSIGTILVLIEFGRFVMAFVHEFTHYTIAFVDTIISFINWILAGLGLL